MRPRPFAVVVTNVGSLPRRGEKTETPSLPAGEDPADIFVIDEQGSVSCMFTENSYARLGLTENRQLVKLSPNG